MLVVDANIMISAMLGQTLPLLEEQAERGIILAAPEAQFTETRKILDRLGVEAIEERMADLMDIIEPIDPALFAHFEDRACERLEPRGRPDWPVLAAAMALEADIWSHDRDFFGVGVPVWSSRNIRHAESAA